MLNPLLRDASRAHTPSNARIFRIYRQPNDQAKMLAQLVRFAKGDPSQLGKEHQKAIAAMVTAFEDAVLREFEQGLSIDDVDGRMKKYAGVLVSLNGGQRAVDAFLERNILFKQRQELGDPESWAGSQDSSNAILERSGEFLGRLSRVLDTQIDMADRVFAPSLNVVSHLVERFVGEVIRPDLCTLFNYLKQAIDEKFLRAISGIYHHCLQFASFLGASSNRLGLSVRSQVAALLDSIYEPYFEIYVAEELKQFGCASTAEIESWEQQLSEQEASVESYYLSNTNRKAVKKDFLTSFKKVILTPVNVLPTFAWSSSTKTVTGQGPPTQHESATNASDLDHERPQLATLQDNAAGSRTADPSMPPIEPMS